MTGQNRKAALRGEVKLMGADKVKADSRYAAVCRRFESGKSDREISRDIWIRPQTVADMREAWEQEKAAGGAGRSGLRNRPITPLPVVPRASRATFLFGKHPDTCKCKTPSQLQAFGKRRK